MSESVWSLRADELLRRTASGEPTPGNGSVAAVTGAFGLGLLLMALEITDDDGCAALRDRGRALLGRVVAAADADVDAFGAVIDARGMPHDDEGEREERDEAVVDATAAAAERPLRLVTALVEALAFAAEVQPTVKPVLVSDVLGGADIMRGAASAAIRAADLNIETLEERGAPAAELRARRDALLRELHLAPVVE